MSFRLVPNSVTLDDLERRNSYIRSVISLNLVTFGADYVKVVEDTPVLTAAEIVFSDISFMAILAGVTPSESDKVRHSVSLGNIRPIISHNLETVQDRK